MTTTVSSTRVDARLDERPNRGLWLVKWLLLIPHVIVLALLWLAFGVLSVAAFFAILFTGRYPRSIFDFNLGVLRWSWRVSFYGYGALGTDRYPPFRLGPEPDYPATLDIAYPERLSRGLVLVKWWLLALPHYLVVGFFVGGGFALWSYGGGLITLLVLIAGVTLLFTGRYPGGIFDLVMGMNRWAFRVCAYAALMTDTYPPFRMDLGGADPAGPPLPAEVPAGTPPSSGWTAGRVVGAVAGALMLVTGLGASAGGGVLLWLDQTQRDAAGYLSTPAERFSGEDYALRFDVADVVSDDVAWWGPTDWLGTVRVRVSPVDGAPLSVGIARTEDVTRYLSAVPHSRFAGGNHGRFGAMRLAGARPPGVPSGQDFWVSATSGTAPLSLTWNAEPGAWSLVVMNSGAGRGRSADIDFGATLPALGPVAVALLGGGVGLLAGGAALIVVLAARTRRPTSST